MTDPTVSSAGQSVWQPVVLDGRHVHLLPLSPSHHDGLCDAVRDGNLWELWYATIPSPERMGAEIERRLALQAAGSLIPFAVVDASGKLAGMTSYLNLDRTVPRVEIGSTWYALRTQRTALNTEAKQLLLTHAFRTLGCAVVELRTHALNTHSRAAIERLGAKFDGTLRHHVRMANGTLRDTVVYSITSAEWPVVEAHLAWQLKRPR